MNYFTGIVVGLMAYILGYEMTSLNYEATPFVLLLILCIGIFIGYGFYQKDIHRMSNICDTLPVVEENSKEETINKKEEKVTESIDNTEAKIETPKKKKKTSSKPKN